jgi:MFS transporter, PAT family, beta-lactamase induction signal transducer AmpG
LFRPPRRPNLLALVSAPKVSTWQSIARAFTSWRTGAVTVMSISSGLPLGIVLYVIPYWMQQEGIDIKTIGLISAAQIPYAFKFVWSPLMDRWAPRWGRKRGWVLIGQLLLIGAIAAFAFSAGRPTAALVALLTLVVSFASATQDIAVDAYAVEVLRPEERAAAVGARNAFARGAMFLGRVINSVGPRIGWGAAFAWVAALFAPLALVTWKSPEPDVPPPPPRTLRAAVWEPFVGFFRHDRALEIAAFLFLYKFGDNLAGALVSPFLGQLGYSPDAVGLGQGTIGLVASILGTFVGGILSTPLGLGRALWVFGFLQIVSNLGYVVVAQLGHPVPWVMYSAIAVEAATSGMGTGAFGVLLLRLTQRRFSATQYALFSSIFALGRTLAGPPAGALVDAIGWRDFFLFTLPVGIPGLLMLQRFVPFRSREIPEQVEHEGAPASVGAPLTLRALATSGALGAVAGTAVAFALNVLLAALKGVHAAGGAFDVPAALFRVLHPVRPVDWVDLVGPPIAGIVVGFAVAAYLAARHGIAAADHAPISPSGPPGNA